MTCRICLEEDNLIQPCNCTGTSAYVHEECLVKWLTMSERTDCEICQYEYDIVELDESRHVCCPKWSFSDDSDTTASVLAVGIIGNFVIMFITTYWDYATEDLFVYSNAMQFIMLLVMHPKINAAQVLCFWKLCSLLYLFISTFTHNNWSYFYFELSISTILVLHTYTDLIKKQKQTVRYINIVDRSTNDETL